MKKTTLYGIINLKEYKRSCFMIQLYNTNHDIVNSLANFLQNIDYFMSKPIINNIANILPAIIEAENITELDLSKCLHSSSGSFNLESFQKKVWRLLNNKNLSAYNLYNAYISKIIEKLPKPRHNKLIVIFDHMYVRNNYIVLMFSLKVGGQGIPLYFRCDNTKDNRHREIDELNKKCLFSEKVIFQAVNDVINLLKPMNTKITFLADRWFNNLKLMKYINDLGHNFCIRVKVNSSIRFLIYDEKEGHYIAKRFYNLTLQKHHSKYYNNILVGHFKFECNLATSRAIASDDPWFILTNIEPNQAIREYGNRFGGIETIFKNQKTNGFNLEKTHTRNINAFENLYALVCIAVTWMVALGADYSKNYHHVKNRINIKFTKILKGKKIRTLSLFNLGLTLFKSVYNKNINYKLKCNMVLYL